MFRRPNPVFTDEYRALVQVLIQARLDCGVTQRTLAARLGKAASHISMIERGQRRLDALEFYEVARSLGLDPVALYERACRSIDAVRKRSA
jgi:transcriptional regulator with XRE-family HTH domain